METFVAESSVRPCLWTRVFLGGPCLWTRGFFVVSHCAVSSLVGPMLGEGNPLPHPLRSLSELRTEAQQATGAGCRLDRRPHGSAGLCLQVVGFRAFRSFWWCLWDRVWDELGGHLHFLFNAFFIWKLMGFKLWVQI